MLVRVSGSADNSIYRKPQSRDAALLRTLQMIPMVSALYTI